MTNAMPVPRGRPTRIRHKSFLFGIVCVGFLAWVIHRGNHATDWEQIARDRFDTADYPGAIDAATSALERDPKNYDLYFLRADAASRVGMPDRAIEDCASALELSPKNDRFLMFQAALLASRSRTEEAIALIDGAIERSPKNVAFIAMAARMRVTLVDQLRRKLEDRLYANHPDRLAVKDLLDGFLAAPTVDSQQRTLLVDPMPGSGLRAQIDADLVKSWSALREADRRLGDLRANGIPLAQAATVRAALDIRLGRLLRAKEDLQSLLGGPATDVGTRKNALDLLAEVLRRCEAFDSLARVDRERVAVDGGKDVAPLPRLADALESQFLSAQRRPAERPAYLAAADAHLAKWRARDLRTLGYRGLAALEFENRPDVAIDLLQEVFDALKSRKDKDASITDPTRARRFLLGLANACRAAKRQPQAIAAIGSLIDLAPNDLDLLEFRAEMYASAGNDAAAAHDLALALAIGPRNPAMFARWLELAGLAEDTAGRNPRQRAALVVEESIRRREEYFRKLEAENASGVPLSAKRKQSSVALTLSTLSDKEVAVASNPVVALFMAEEYGHRGMTVEARNFLSKASAGLPGVLELVYRLGLLRVDLGLYSSAAEDFESILERDPTDAEVAEAAYEAWVLAGDVARARRVRARAALADPDGAGRELCLRSAVENGNPVLAMRALAPIAARPAQERTVRENALIGHVAIAAGAGALGRVTLAAIPREAETAEILRDRLLIAAMSNNHAEFDECANRFVTLPRLLAAPDILDLVAKLESGRRYAEAASIASRVAVRYPEQTELVLNSRAAVDALLAGDPDPLRKLRERTDLGPDLGNDVVRAAFGLTLRENGAPAAAKYLQRVREFTKDRDWAALPTAAAFALTPYFLDVGSFLTRYEESLRGKPIPLDDAVLYFVTRQRDPAKRPLPDVEDGAAGELLWLREVPGKKDKDAGIDELYLLFFLYQFAGRGFELEAHAVAQQLARFDEHAQTPARYVAAALEERQGPVMAGAWLLPHYHADPGDIRTYRAMGRIMIAADPTGDTLAQLALSGRDRFPTAHDPDLFGAIAAAKRRDLGPAREAAERAARLAATPAAIDDVLLGFLHICDVFHDPEVSRELARRILAAKSRHPFLREFLVRRYAGHTELDHEAIPVLGLLLADDPTFYDAAAIVARSLANAEKDAELVDLARRLTVVIPADATAGAAGDVIAQVVRVLIERKRGRPALDLAEAGLLADPSSAALRKARVDLISMRDGSAATIEDLRLLATLAPDDVGLLLLCAKTLLEETDTRIEAVRDLVGVLATRTPDDPNYRALLAWLRFRSDDLKGARREIGFSLARQPKENAFRYAAGVFAWLDGDAKMAQESLAAVEQNYEFWPRAREILGLIKR